MELDRADRQEERFRYLPVAVSGAGELGDPVLLPGEQAGLVAAALERQGRPGALRPEGIAAIARDRVGGLQPDPSPGTSFRRRSSMPRS